MWQETARGDSVFRCLCSEDAAVLGRIPHCRRQVKNDWWSPAVMVRVNCVWPTCSISNGWMMTSAMFWSNGLGSMRDRREAVEDICHHSVYTPVFGVENKL